MARTALSDVFVAETFNSYQMEDPVIKSELVSSGILVTNGEMNAIADNIGFITTMPFWTQVDSSVEPNYSNDVYTDQAVPQKVTAEEQIARITNLNNGWGSADLVTQLSGADPMKHVAAHIDQYWQEQLQKRVIAMSIGLYNDNVAGNAGDMVINISSVNNTIAANNRFSASAMISASLTLGDSMKKITGIAVHSMVFGKMLTDDEIVYIKPSANTLEIPTYKGKTVIVDDGMPIIGGDGATVAYKYLTILFGQGAFGYGNGTPHVPSAKVRDEDRGNGGGFETLWSRKRWLLHPYGYKFISTTITGPGLSATWADLKLATNWTRIMNRKNVRLAFLVHNV